jgi:hypothetical protein
MENISEEWRPINGHPNYEVSNLGRVRSIDRTITYADGQIRYYDGRILKVGLNGGAKNNRYPAVCLTGAKRFYVHRVVAEAFHGPAPAPGYEVAHRDGNRRNPRSDNLRWDTRAGNCADKVGHGTASPGLGKLDPTKVKLIKLLLAENLVGERIAHLFGVTPPAISHIRTGKTWSYITI